jgi:hypothetical protein
MLSRRTRVVLVALTLSAIVALAPAQSQACGLFSWLCPSCWSQPATVGYAPAAAPVCAAPTFAPAVASYPPAYTTTSFRPTFWESLCPLNWFSCLHPQPQTAYFAPAPVATFCPAPACPTACDPCAGSVSACDTGCSTGCNSLSYSGVDSSCASCVGGANSAPVLDTMPMPQDGGVGSDGQSPPSTFKDNGTQGALQATPDASTRSSIMTMPRLIQPERQTRAMPVHRTSYERPADEADLAPLDVSGWRAAR